MARKLLDWSFNYVGSTRSAALIRIGLALMIWYRFVMVGFHALPKALWATLALATFCMLIGYRSRISSLISGAIALITYYYFWEYLGHKNWAHHHTYFLGIDAIWLSLAPCGGSYSLDRLLATDHNARANLPAPREEGNLLGLRLLAIQLAALYFFAFWDKVFIADTNEIFWGFLNGSRLQEIFAFEYSGSDFVFHPWMNALSPIPSVAVAILDYCYPCY